ncbi:MAG: DNA-directed DNA polymerase II small subunit [Methanomassiliicoccales archaeon]|nr:MAG: DNA-directed DNA polymerase II small subunit [Methanomassiliicoccales archaeon]
MRDRILSFLTDYGTLVQTEAVDYIMSKEEPISYMERVLENIEEPPFILTVEHLRKVEGITQIAASKAEITKTQTEVEPKTQFIPEEKPLDNFVEKGIIAKKRELAGPVQELPGEINLFSDISGNSTCQGKIGDFKLYFNDRLKTLRRLLKARRGMAGVIPLSGVKRADSTFKIIGMVSDIRMTRKGNKRVTIEDENTSVNVLLTKGTALVNDPTVLDEVIGLFCSKFRDDRPFRNDQLLKAEEVVRPDVPVNRPPNRSEKTVYAAFVSDVHVGSNTFLKEEFDDFLAWLNGTNGRKRDVAKSVRYIVVPGDVVDGIGVYPDQEEELAINDIYGQYEELARLFSRIPEHIKVIMLPGNHDAVRPAEPQPTFPSEIRELFGQNVIFTGNPCYFSLHGVEILAYHGRSMDDFIKALPSLDYSKAKKIMIEMLKKRHLVPIYGGRTPIAPEHKDYLVIDRVPDIFVTGHGHATDMGKYRGVTLINASCWQAQTKYQKMHNFIPDPAKVPIVNLKTGEASIIDFS